MSDQELIERIRKAKNRQVLSEYIRVGQSDLYDFEPVRRAVLREIAFLQVNDEKTKVPKHSPFKGQYEGWCYASQRFLAFRVSTTEDYVRECVALMEKDGVLITRMFTDPMGYRHQEYHVQEDVVTAHQRPEGYMEYAPKLPRRGGNKKANKGSFKSGNQARATGVDSRSHRGSQPNATGVDSRMPPGLAAVQPPVSTAFSHTAANYGEAVLVQGGKGPQGGFDFDSDTPARAQASASSAFQAAEGRENGGGVPASQQNLKTPKVREPLPNRLCYKEAFKHCYDKNDKWIVGMKVPKCRRCKANLQPNENHECEGYVPQYPTMDTEARERSREDLREDRRAQRDWDIAQETFGAEFD